MRGQRRLFDPQRVTAQQFDPVDFVAEGARRYATERGLNWRAPSPQLQVDPERGHAQFLSYRAHLEASEDSPEIKTAYEAATRHINEQYDFMTRPTERGGMGVRHEVVEDDPYPGPREMAEDLRTNRRIRTYATTSTSVGGEQAPTLQAFDNETNDRFRAVHDVFGHAAIGRGFSRHGEEAAYQSHVGMFPPEAHRALASETRGQNSFLNYGPKAEFPNPGVRMVDMPQWATETGPLPTPQRQPARRVGRQLRLF